MIYRNENFAEENIDPSGHPAATKYEEWENDLSERIIIRHRKRKVCSDKERRRRMKGMDEIVRQDIAGTPRGGS